MSHSLSSTCILPLPCVANITLGPSITSTVSSRALPNLRHEHLKLTQLRPKHSRLAILAPLKPLTFYQRRFRIMLLERQCIREELSRVAISDWAEARGQHIVGPGHALDNVAGEVGVETIGRNENRLSR